MSPRFRRAKAAVAVSETELRRSPRSDSWWPFQNPRDCCAGSGGATLTPSISSIPSFVEEPPGAEKPPILPPAARTRWHGMISAPGFFAIAWPTSRAASGPAPSFLRKRAVGRRAAPRDLSRGLIDLLEKDALSLQIEIEAGKIRLPSLEIVLHRRDRFGNPRRRLVRRSVGQTPQKQSLGGFGASRRQLEARDAGIAPGDAAETACGFENMVMVHEFALLQHRMPD
jgi:hypothetical protein